MLSDKNRQFLFYALVVVGCSVIGMASWHFIGLLTQPVPSGVQGQLWIFASIVLGIAIQAAREYAARPARQLTQAKLDATQSTLNQLSQDVHNGIQIGTAQKAADIIIPAVADIVHEKDAPQ